MPNKKDNIYFMEKRFINYKICFTKLHDILYIYSGHF